MRVPVQRRPPARAPPNAVATGKPLWASENGSQDFNNGAAAMARADNRDYLDGKMTATINWPIVASIYPDLPVQRPTG